MASEDEGPVHQLNVLAKYAERLPEIIEISKNIAPGLQLREVTAKIPASVGISQADLRAIFIALDQVRLVAENIGSPAKAFDRLSQYYGPQALAAVLQKRDAIESAVPQFTGDHPAAVSLKASRLTYTRENLITDIEVVTDARPVYDDAGSRVLEWIITHTLVLTYLHNGEATRMLFTVDATDVEKMGKQGTRAIIKAGTLKKELGETARIVATHNA